MSADSEETGNKARKASIASIASIAEALGPDPLGIKAQFAVPSGLAQAFSQLADNAKWLRRFNYESIAEVSRELNESPAQQITRADIDAVKADLAPIESNELTIEEKVEYLFNTAK